MIDRLFHDKRIHILFLAVVCCLMLGIPTGVMAQDYVVVANKGLGLTSISSADLEAIFTGKKRFWDSGEKVVFALYGDDDLQATFLKVHVHKTPSQFKNFWTKMVFTGKGSMPESFNTPEQVIDFVSRQQGAVSFVPAPGSGKVAILKIN